MSREDAEISKSRSTCSNQSEGKEMNNTKTFDKILISLFVIGILPFLNWLGMELTGNNREEVNALLAASAMLMNIYAVIFYWLMFARKNL